MSDDSPWKNKASRVLAVRRALSHDARPSCSAVYRNKNSAVARPDSAFSFPSARVCGMGVPQGKRHKKLKSSAYYYGNLIRRGIVARILLLSPPPPPPPRMVTGTVLYRLLFSDLPFSPHTHGYQALNAWGSGVEKSLFDGGLLQKLIIQDLTLSPCPWVSGIDIRSQVWF